MTQQFKAQVAGRYMSMTVNSRNISIHESYWLEEGDEMVRPIGAYIMLVAESPDPEETR
jgi:hypothetical protein